MKSILVPTDFSACAADATDVAMRMADRFNAKVHLYTCLDLPKGWYSMDTKERAQHRDALQRIRNAETLMAAIEQQYSYINVETAYSGGILAEKINEYASRKGIDLVVMGSHGAGGKNEHFIGSNTQRVVRMVHCPVLVVKDKLENVEFQKVVFASNFDQSEKTAFLHFKEFIKHFIPEIHLVSIHSSAFLDAPMTVQKELMEEFRNLAKPLKCEIHIIQGYSVDEGIRYFSEKIGADLVAISNHQRRPLKRLFVGSNVEALVNHSQLPVLSVDYLERQFSDAET